MGLRGFLAAVWDNKAETSSSINCQSSEVPLPHVYSAIIFPINPIIIIIVIITIIIWLNHDLHQQTRGSSGDPLQEPKVPTLPFTRKNQTGSPHNLISEVKQNAQIVHFI